MTDYINDQPGVDEGEHPDQRVANNTQQAFGEATDDLSDAARRVADDAHEAADDAHRALTDAHPKPNRSTQEFGEEFVKFAQDTAYAAVGFAGLVGEKAKAFYEEQKRQYTEAHPEAEGTSGTKHFLSQLRERIDKFVEELTQGYKDMAERGRQSSAKFADTVGEKAGTVADKAKATADDLADKAKGAADDLADKAKAAAADFSESQDVEDAEVVDEPVDAQRAMQEPVTLERRDAATDVIDQAGYAADGAAELGEEHVDELHEDKPQD